MHARHLLFMTPIAHTATVAFPMDRQPSSILPRQPPTELDATAHEPHEGDTTASIEPEAMAQEPHFDVGERLQDPAFGHSFARFITSLPSGTCMYWHILCICALLIRACDACSMRFLLRCNYFANRQSPSTNGRRLYYISSWMPFQM
jgi:hypothetical protein